MKVSEIEASLEQGRYFSGKILALLILCANAFVFYYLFLGVLSLVFFFNGNFSENYFDIVDFSIYGLCVVFSSGVCIWLLVINAKIKKKILLYVNDAIPLQAYSRKLSSFRTLGQPFPEVKIEVSFRIGDKRYTRISGDGKKRSKMYQKIYRKYADREINILYSPKYDQVLILKDKKPTKKT